MCRKRLPVLEDHGCLRARLGVGSWDRAPGMLFGWMLLGTAHAFALGRNIHKPAAHELVGVPLSTPLHPTQLYESLGELVIFAVLYLQFLRPHREGSVISLYLVLYGILRFLVEFVRFHDQQSNPLTGPFSTEQWISLVLVAAGLCYWLFARRRQAVTTVTSAAAT